jgi:hypothetical protein
MYRIIILPVVYGCEIWSPRLREERRSRVFGKRVLRKILGPERDEVAGEWSRLYSKELHGLFSPNSIRVIKSRTLRYAGHVVFMGKRRGSYRVWGGGGLWERTA